jgi:hypothetical protein
MAQKHRKRPKGADVHTAEVKSAGNKEANFTTRGAPRLSASNQPRAPSADAAAKGTKP